MAMNLGFLVLVAAIGFQAAPSRVNDKGVDLRCGEYCLAVALNALDIASPGVAELEGKLGQPGSLGFSMKQLADVAEQYGAYTLGVDTSLEQLERRRGRFACIALDPERGHFFCIADVTPRSVHIIDPPNQTEATREAFARLWKGRALLISNRPIDPSVPGWLPRWAVILGWSLVAAFVILVGARFAARRRPSKATAALTGVLGCGIFTGLACGQPSSTPATLPPGRVEAALPLVAIEPKEVDLGLMGFTPGSSLRGQFTIRNGGTAPLHLFSGDVSCGCTVIDPIPGVLEPGKSTTVHVGVKPKNSTGEQGSSVMFRTDDPVSPAVRVSVRWRERSALTVEPTVVDFGWVGTGHAAERVVAVVVAPELARETFEVKTLDRAVSTSWMADSTRADDGGQGPRKLTVKLEPSREPGDGAATLVIRDAHSPYSVSLPVSWKSGPPITVTPKAFFHSKVRPNTKVANRLVVRSATGNAIRVSGFDVDGERGTVDDPGGQDPLGPASDHGDRLGGRQPRARASCDQGVPRRARRRPLDGPGVPVHRVTRVVVRASDRPRSIRRGDGSVMEDAQCRDVTRTYRPPGRPGSH